MEGTYACNLNNRFELFLDEENDPLEILAKSQQDKRKGTEKSKDVKKDAKKKGLSKTLKESVKTIAAAVDTNAAPKPLAGRTNVGYTSPTQAGGNANLAGTRPPRRENVERRNNERNFEPRPDGDRPPRENRGPRDGNRPPRNFDGPRPEGGRNFRNDNNRGSRDGQRGGLRGREFDRHSGDVRSGVKATEKRGGLGAHNWGKITEFDTAPDAEVTENVEATAEVGAGEEVAVPAEPEAVQMTLEQWKKEQASKKSKTEYAANIRKPNEGEKEDPKLKKAVTLRKKKTDDDDSEDAEGDEAHDAEDECEKLKKELEQTLASQFHFADVRGPARGGRGGRSSGPQGSRREEGQVPTGRQPRGGKPQHTPRVEDLNDFPSLAA